MPAPPVRSLAVVVEDRRQIARGDPRAVAKGDRSLNGGFELADVARPVVLLQDVERIPGEAGDGFMEFAGVLGPERLGQELDVGAAVPKRGEHQADHADPVIELLAKPALLDQGGQVFAGGHEEPRLARLDGMPGAGLVVAEVQLAEQMELKFEGQRGHFVEDRACRPGPGPACWPNPERGSLDGGTAASRRLLHRLLVGHRRPLHGDERVLRARARASGSSGPEATCRFRARRRSRTEVRVAAIVAARSMTWRQLGSVPIKPSSRARQLDALGAAPDEGAGW